MSAKQAKKKALYAITLKAARVRTTVIEKSPRRDLDRVAAYLSTTQNDFVAKVGRARAKLPNVGDGVSVGKLARR